MNTQETTVEINGIPHQKIDVKISHQDNTDTLQKLRKRNIERSPYFGMGEAKDISLEFKAIELAGEMGELLNVVKKMLRGETESFEKGEKISIEDQLRGELADIVICVDLLAAKYDINLNEEIVKKFNKTSKNKGFPILMN